METAEKRSYIVTGTLATRRNVPTNPEGPVIGETRRFIPTAMTLTNQGHSMASFGIAAEGLHVTGVCVYVSEAHRIARYRYQTRTGGYAYECFNF